MAEYRYGEAGAQRVIVQPRILAQTAVIERHVIRSEVAGTVIDPVVTQAERRATVSPAMPQAERGPLTEAGQAWHRFVEQFTAETRFDDPGQPPPRRGGNGWMRVPLPAGLYINVYRSLATQRIGVQVRFPGAEGLGMFRDLEAEDDLIDAEFAAVGLEPPACLDTEAPELLLTHPSPSPWDEAIEVDQRAWLGRAANQMVNSLRPRLQPAVGELAA